MSETPSENGQLDTADEPSMEDILASIRKIISDDDQGAEFVEADTSQSSGGLNSKGYASEALVTGSFGHAPSAPEPEPVSDSYDENSVFNSLRGSSGLDDILQNDFESDEELVDLDIEALLSEAEAPLETLDDGLDESPSDEESLMDILAMDIPEPEDDLSINPAENHNPETVLSVGGTQAFDSDIHDIEAMESLDSLLEPDSESESDSLFDELEGFLTDEVGAGDETELESLASFALEDVPEPILERKERKGLLGAGLAAVGFGAKARQKSTEKTETEKTGNESQTITPETPDVEEVDVQAPSRTSADDDLDAMLETLMGDVEPAALDTKSVEASLVSGELEAPELESPGLKAEKAGAVTRESENMPGLQTDADEMDLVKSLMADLSDPESQVSPSEIDQDDLNETDEFSLEFMDEDILETSESEGAGETMLASEDDLPEEDDDIDNYIEALLNGDIDETSGDDIITSPNEPTETAVSDSTSGSILDDILDMSLEDELGTHEDDLGALLEIPELDEPETVVPEAVAVASQSSNTLSETVPMDNVSMDKSEDDTETSLEDDIFELTEDDMVPNLDDVLEDEAENIVLNDIEAIADESPADDTPNETSSLLEIAMEAEKEAEIFEAKPVPESEPVIEQIPVSAADTSAEAASETVSEISGGAVAAASGLGLAAIAAASSGILQTVETKSSEEDVEASEAQPTSTPAPETHNIAPEPEQIIQKETAEMPSAAAKSDTILDEVTTSSTAEVFASLNQVVEEKAIVAERGDRVGDLVMDALRPMLKEWLDENLKGIVERAVTKEVKRISSGK